MPVLGLVVGRGADNGLRPKARRCHTSPCAGRRELTEPTEATPAAVVTAVRDACVLFSATLRDTLLRAAAIRLCEPYLTDTILEEVSRNVVRRGRMSEERAAHLVEAMRSAFPPGSRHGLRAPRRSDDERSEGSSGPGRRRPPCPLGQPDTERLTCKEGPPTRSIPVGAGAPDRNRRHSNPLTESANCCNVAPARGPAPFSADPPPSR